MKGIRGFDNSTDFPIINGSQSTKGGFEMSDLSNELKAIRENPDVISIIEVYREAKRVYYDTLEAMGRIAEITYGAASSAESPISLRTSASTHDNKNQRKAVIPKFSDLEKLPVSYQEINDFVNERASLQINLFDLRKETFRRIEGITKRPLVCYVTKTRNLPPRTPTSIDDSDLVGFDDLVLSVPDKAVDVFIVSNGGLAEATERIVQLLRNRFDSVRFIIPANAYSAATLMSFSGDEIIMRPTATLGPIDPQVNGIPAQAIIESFEGLEKRVQEEGPKAIAPYVPLIEQYDLAILEICKSAQALSAELADNWLNDYMFRDCTDKPNIQEIVKHFSDYKTHKSHGRSIDRNKAQAQNLKVTPSEEIKGLDDLIRSLYNQYDWWFDKTLFYKVFENAHGIAWGRQLLQPTQMPIMFPPGAPQPTPQPPPE